jgi:hypothetical protein
MGCWKSAGGGQRNRSVGDGDGSEDALMVFQHGVNALLDLDGKTLQVSGPCMPATVALDHHDSAAFHDEFAAVVTTLRTLDVERVACVRHG